MTEPNIDLLYKTLDHIETLEAFRAEGVYLKDRWNQGTWAIQYRDSDGDLCGTACCFAGWAVHLAGDHFVNDVGCDMEGCDCDEIVAEAPDGNIEHIAERAQELLGLDWRERGRLFNGSNTLDQLREVVAQIKDGTLRD